MTGVGPGVDDHASDAESIGGPENRSEVPGVANIVRRDVDILRGWIAEADILGPPMHRRGESDRVVAARYTPEVRRVELDDVDPLLHEAVDLLPGPVTSKPGWVSQDRLNLGPTFDRVEHLTYAFDEHDALVEPCLAVGQGTYPPGPVALLRAAHSAPFPATGC